MSIIATDRSASATGRPDEHGRDRDQTAAVGYVRGRTVALGDRQRLARQASSGLEECAATTSAAGRSPVSSVRERPGSSPGREAAENSTEGNDPDHRLETAMMPTKASLMGTTIAQPSGRNNAKDRIAAITPGYRSAGWRSGRYAARGVRGRSGCRRLVVAGATTDRLDLLACLAAGPGGVWNAEGEAAGAAVRIATGIAVAHIYILE